MLIHVDNRRTLAIAPDETSALQFAAEHFISCAKEAISDHGSFFVALSGGSTPKSLFRLLSSAPYAAQLDWHHFHLFWSDERAVPPGSPESNYQMAMKGALERMPIPQHQIHRMQAEQAIEQNALDYEKLLQQISHPLDLVMLGMGEDGHTASLFPGTLGLQTTERLAIANFIPQKNSWRMTLTLEAINQAQHIVFYVFGAAKQAMLATVLGPLLDPPLPAQLVGTPKHPALWIVDAAAAGKLAAHFQSRKEESSHKDRHNHS